MAVEAASKLVPAGKAASSLGALGGMMNQAGNGNGSNTPDGSEEKESSGTAVPVQRALDRP